MNGIGVDDRINRNYYLQTDPDKLMAYTINSNDDHISRLIGAFESSSEATMRFHRITLGVADDMRTGTDVAGNNESP